MAAQKVILFRRPVMITPLLYTEVADGTDFSRFYGQGIRVFRVIRVQPCDLPDFKQAVV